MNCERCNKKTLVTTMSWLNEEIICLDCEEKSDYTLDIKRQKILKFNMLNKEIIIIEVC